LRGAITTILAIGRKYSGCKALMCRLARQDSNLEQRLQRPLCYRYTTRHRRTAQAIWRSCRTLCTQVYNGGERVGSVGMAGGGARPRVVAEGQVFDAAVPRYGKPFDAPLTHPRYARPR